MKKETKKGIKKYVLREKKKIPNEETIKAMEEKDDQLFEAANAYDMIADCVGDLNWEKNLYHSDTLRNSKNILERFLNKLLMQEKPTLLLRQDCSRRTERDLSSGKDRSCHRRSNALLPHDPLQNLCHADN